MSPPDAPGARSDAPECIRRVRLRHQGARAVGAANAPGGGQGLGGRGPSLISADERRVGLRRGEFPGHAQTPGGHPALDEMFRGNAEGTRHVPEHRPVFRQRQVRHQGSEGIEHHRSPAHASPVRRPNPPSPGARGAPGPAGHSPGRRAPEPRQRHQGAGQGRMEDILGVLRRGQEALEHPPDRRPERLHPGHERLWRTARWVHRHPPSTVNVAGPGRTVARCGAPHTGGSGVPTPPAAHAPCSPPRAPEQRWPIATIPRQASPCPRSARLPPAGSPPRPSPPAPSQRSPSPRPNGPPAPWPGGRWRPARARRSLITESRTELRYFSGTEDENAEEAGWWMLKHRPGKRAARTEGRRNAAQRGTDGT